MRHVALFFAIALLGAALDLLTKELVFRAITDGREVTVIDGFFSIGKTTNRGVIFGKFPGAEKLWLWVSILAVPAILAIFFSVKNPKWILTISLGMILGGTLGNMYDRVAWGAVRDFIKFYVVVDKEPKIWPLFNLADSFICVGVFLLTVEMLFFDEKKRKKDEAARAEPSPPAGPAAAGVEGPVAGAGPVVEGK